MALTRAWLEQWLHIYDSLLGKLNQNRFPVHGIHTIH
jgi:hypothetical protein